MALNITVDNFFEKSSDGKLVSFMTDFNYFDKNVLNHRLFVQKYNNDITFRNINSMFLEHLKDLDYIKEKCCRIAFLNKLTEALRGLKEHFMIVMVLKIYKEFSRPFIANSDLGEKIKQRVNEMTRRANTNSEVLERMSNMIVKKMEESDKIEFLTDQLKKKNELLIEMTDKLNEYRVSYSEEAKYKKTIRELDTKIKTLIIEKEDRDLINDQLTDELNAVREEYQNLLEIFVKEAENQDIELDEIIKELKQKEKKIKELSKKIQFDTNVSKNYVKDIRNLLEEINTKELNKVYVKTKMKEIQKEEVIICLNKNEGNFLRNEKSTKFFTYTLNEPFYDRLKKWFLISKDEFEKFLYIDPKSPKNPKILRRFLLKFLKKICSKTGSKTSVFYRNFLTKHRPHQYNNINAKFYHTYINPLNDENEISLEEFLKLTSRERRKHFIEKYKEFDKETSNMLSLYESDNVKTRFFRQSLEEINHDDVIKKIIRNKEERNKSYEGLKKTINEKIRFEIEEYMEEQ